MLTYNDALIKQGVRDILIGIGEDPEREGLKETPDRVMRFYKEWLGYNSKVKDTAFSAQYDEMVIVKDIPFYSLCEHHMLPFIGVAHIGYIPDKNVLGISKLVRILNKYSRRLQIQERLTDQVAEELLKSSKALGCMVVISAEHMCMSMRGVRVSGAKTVTSSLKGIFKNPQDGKDPKGEFLKLINGGC